MESIMQIIGTQGFNVVGIALLVWVMVKYLPQRDKEFIAELKTMREADAAAHTKIIEMINEHDKITITYNNRVGRLIREIEKEQD